ncbi:MAG TPA: sodium-dependent bicarbonate transport family permease [Alphaproteobacteria bacterium]|nr:sodium-dependent bicarbonate transport family permease [Alphaproteobacteria bacterium]
MDPVPALDGLSVLLSAPILFFALGIAAALIGTELPLPEGFDKTLASYLIVALGLKGGAALASNGDPSAYLPVLLAGAGLSFALPFLAFALLRAATRLDRLNAAAVAAHYGSVSLVTFIAAGRFVEGQGLAYGGHMVAVLAVMEAPAIVSGLILAGRDPALAARPGAPAPVGTVLREALTNGSVVLLVGALAVGMAVGQPGLDKLAGFFVAPFDGVLCLFLLAMGFVATRRLREARSLTPALVGFALAMPLLGGACGLGLGWALGLGTAELTLFTTLAASCSYIAVPAALRHALPSADPAVSMPLALAVTFPFNIMVGIPLYHGWAAAVAG